MRVKRIAHIAIAVRDLEQQIPFYRDVLGLELVCRETVEDQKVTAAMFQIGESTIELLEPTTEDSPISKFLDKRGEGIHHVAYEVDALQSSLDELEAKGVRLLDRQPRDGAHGAKIAFAHPKSTGGVLTELCQHDE